MEALNLDPHLMKTLGSLSYPDLIKKRDEWYSYEPSYEPTLAAEEQQKASNLRVLEALIAQQEIPSNKV